MCTAGCMCLSVVDAMGSEGTEGLAFGARAWGPWDSTLTTLLTEPCCPSLLQLAPGVNSGQGLGIEIIGTLQLVLCVLATTDRRRRDLGGSGPPKASLWLVDGLLFPHVASSLCVYPWCLLLFL